MSPKDTRFAGRRALVTGSTGGLGVAIATALAADGAFVVVSGRDKARGDAVVEGIRAAGGQAAFVVADLGAGTDAVRDVADAAAEAARGSIDILVNNAATLLMPTPTADITEQELRELLAFYKTNLGRKVLSDESSAVEDGFKRAQEWTSEFSDQVLTKMRVEMRKKGHDL